MSLSGWDENYRRGRANRYPFEGVVGTILRAFSGADRSKVSVLDLGCGGGNHLKFLRDEGFEYFGCDGAPAAIEKCAALLGLAPGEAATRLKVAPFTALPFPAAAFDAVIDRQSIGHNRGADLDAIFGEVRRVLKPGGFYYGHVFSAGSESFRFGRETAPGDFEEFSGGNFASSHLVHAFTAGQIQDLLAGFTITTLVRQTRDHLIGSVERIETFEIHAAKAP